MFYASLVLNHPYVPTSSFSFSLRPNSLVSIVTGWSRAVWCACFTWWGPQADVYATRLVRQGAVGYYKPRRGVGECLGTLEYVRRRLLESQADDVGRADWWGGRGARLSSAGR